MDSILKLIYPYRFTQHKIEDYFFNGLHPEVVKHLQKKCDEKQEQFNLEYELGELVKNGSSDWLYCCHSNLLYYFLRYSKNDSNPILDGNNILDDGNIYLYPFEIRTTINNISSEVSVVLDDNKTIKYNILDTIPSNILELIRKGKVKIIFNIIQDPCVSLEQLITFENFLNEHGISGDSVIFIWGNDIEPCMKERFPDSKIKSTHSILPLYQQAESTLKFPRETSLGYMSDIVRKNDINSKTIRSKRFLCFNRTPKPHRFMLAYLALKYDLLEKNYFSFILDDQLSEQHIYECLCMFKDRNTITIKDAKKIKDLLPYHLDTENLPKEQLLGFTTDNNKKEFYLNSYVHITSETLFLNDISDSIFFSEKTFRPIQNLQPFIFVGEPFSLRLLHRLGFKTFSPFIDESYDVERDPNKRMYLIEKEIVKLNNMPIKELHNWYHSIIDILEFNQNHFISFASTNPFERVFDEINKFYSK